MDGNFRFVDLFCGIGGFHQAMSNLGGVCVFASEVDRHCIETYRANYGIDCDHDIRDVDVGMIPPHDVLCAGFPCQSFSKAGNRLGFEDIRGTLFFEIARVLDFHHPKYIILENVRNLVSHDCGNTYETIVKTLKGIGYRLTSEPLISSPHHFGTPQLRERCFILGMYDPSNIDKPLDVDLGKQMSKDENSIYTVLDDFSDEGYGISEYEERILMMWDDFYKGIDLNTIGFPVWFDWFKKEAPDDFKDWKKRYISKNNELYQRNKEFIDSWIEKWDNLEWCSPTHRKFEWQAGDRIDSVWEGIIQFRPSGIRVKVPTCFPSLVAMVHIPIIGRYRRRLTVREAARLQDFNDDFVPNPNERKAFKQLGNSVNVKVVMKCAEELIK